MKSGNRDIGDYAGFVKGCIAEQYMEEIYLRDLAARAHVSISHLSAQFKKETGMSFTEYLIRYRMERAKELLESGRAENCRKAAEAVGYIDYAQFSKMFKKYMGVSPSMVERGGKKGRRRRYENNCHCRDF